MRSILILFPIVMLGCMAATTTNDYYSLRDEAPPTWLPVPVAGIRASQLRDTWGAVRSEGRTHEGIDIPARRGTPVLSTTRGVVSAVQWRERGGNTVSVLGPGGYSHYYAHLDSYGPHAVGAWVDPGDTIGFVGNTGNAQGTTPHLHYGIYTSEGAINPYPLLAAPKSAATKSAATKPAATKSSDTVTKSNRKSSTTKESGSGKSWKRKKGKKSRRSR
jgi:murein DD-endopeptidase MepM/ murein hydrolase activator NlpD